ncbi:HEAT repeat domain-containing protein, partial [bacterium]|nr:HEAT repeat domain-containing protein [bacterium]
GGMENTSATTLNERTLHDARAHMDYESDGLVSHELAHQWWGDLLTCRDWAHIWLNEGFASYFEALWDEKKNGQDAFEYNMFEKGHGAREGACRTRPVVDHHYQDAENVFDGRAYPKGAWVLHGLRRRLGDEAFWRSINRYCKAHAYGTVETIDLRRAFEEETGDSLERYFNDWTERPAHPALEVAYEWNEKDKLLEATIRQTQQGEPFAFRATLAASLGKPAEGLRVSVSMEEKEKRVLIPFKARPRYVRFDADEAVLKEITEHKGDDQWLVQIAEDPNVCGRIRAAQVLAEKRFAPGFEAVGKALAEDAFWGVSVECARALGKVGGDAARDALLRGLAHKHPKVRRASVEALSGYHKDAKVIAALRPLVEKGDPSYYVESQAALAYSKVRADDARTWLEKALERPSHNEVIREAALSGLAELEDPSALPICEKTASAPGDPGMRRTAIAAMGRVAALPTVDDETRRKVVSRLARFVDEEGMRLRIAAVEALSAIGKDAAPALASLEAVMRHDAETRVRDAAKAAVDRIRAGTPPNIEISRLRDEVQKLKENEERLQKRLDQIEAKSQASAGPPTEAPAKPGPGTGEKQPY